MILLSNIVYGVATILDTVLSIYSWVIIIATLLTWVRPDPYNPIVRTLNAVTEPVFYRVRKHLPFTFMSGIDLSPVVVLLGIQLVKLVVVRTMLQWSALL